ncbi:hypothetical protein ONE63_008060 [Megalurothrips usitatus]|uniref:Uncharacterized protein n=1 Tax=Megalurothrips usitatus TaxID=439358 RepID=A0AAV7XSY8_9NEOP|nr:hypothetical protein ONE63_008060 [Megalurothrips usitatus]
MTVNVYRDWSWRCAACLLCRGLVRAGTTTVAEWEEFIEDALPPSGHLHPTHHLVLRAKRQILCPDRTGEEGDIVNLKLRIPKSLGRRAAASAAGISSGGDGGRRILECCSQRVTISVEICS